MNKLRLTASLPTLLVFTACTEPTARNDDQQARQNLASSSPVTVKPAIDADLKVGKTAARAAEC